MHVSKSRIFRIPRVALFDKTNEPAFRNTVFESPSSLMCSTMLCTNGVERDVTSESLSAAGGTKTASTIDASPIQF